MDYELELSRLMERHPDLRICREDIELSFTLLTKTILENGKILVCGNGGSAADCEHLVGELMKGFENLRPLSSVDVDKFRALYGNEGEEIARNLQGAIPAISLVSQSAFMTAFNNDCDPRYVYAQQVWAYGQPQDSIICITTSGNSANVVNAAKAAKARRMRVIGLTGSNGGQLEKVADVTVRVPRTRTCDVQELHLPVYHSLCLMLEMQQFSPIYTH